MTNQRIAVVVGSQCSQAAELNFLPPIGWSEPDDLPAQRKTVHELYEQLMDPAAGACAPASGLVGEPEAGVSRSCPSLLINPTLASARLAVEMAYKEAFDSHAPGLVLLFCGHGYDASSPHEPTKRHYLLVADSSATPGTGSQGWNVYQQLGELRSTYPGVAIVLLVDACFASSAESEISHWYNTEGRRPFLWAGASHQTPAAGGRFTRHLTDIMKTGLSSVDHPTEAVPTQLRGEEIFSVIDARIEGAPNAPAQKVATHGKGLTDAALFICNNRARIAEDVHLGFCEETARRFQGVVDGTYVPVGLADFEARFTDSNFTIVEGSAGTGKTRLAATLRRPPPQETGVIGFDAVGFLEAGSTQDSLAAELHPQLLQYSRYKAAHAAFAHADRIAYDSARSFDRYLSGPISFLRQGSVSVVIDGVDQVGDIPARTELVDSLFLLSMTHNSRLKVLLTTRDGVLTVPEPAMTLTMPLPSASRAARYLSDRGVTDAEAVVDGMGIINWLVLDLTADAWLRNHPVDSADLGGLYSALLAEAMAHLSDEQTIGLEWILRLLAVAGLVAGVGSRLPVDLLRIALDSIGQTPDNLHRMLANPALYRIIERSYPATPSEHLGLFHKTAIDAICSGLGEREAAHDALATAIARAVNREVGLQSS